MAERISEHFLVRMLLGLAISPYILILTTVTTTTCKADSALTVRQRSRKMAVIHFVPRHRQGSFSLLPITSRPDSASQQDTAPFRSGPGPPYSRGLSRSG
ncbi:hypothetical protein INR49_005670 [Caranx melampygus]|nr:hypothetical protein INR49_005670 [Caranx melampygus]